MQFSTNSLSFYLPIKIKESGIRGENLLAHRGKKQPADFPFRPETQQEKNLSSWPKPKKTENLKVPPYSIGKSIYISGSSGLSRANACQLALLPDPRLILLKWSRVSQCLQISLNIENSRHCIYYGISPLNNNKRKIRKRFLVR